MVSRPSAKHNFGELSSLLTVKTLTGFWWTLMLKLKAFTLSSAEALWLKGVREGALPVASRARSNSVRPRASQLRIEQNF